MLYTISLKWMTWTKSKSFSLKLRSSSARPDFKYTPLYPFSLSIQIVVYIYMYIYSRRYRIWLREGEGEEKEVLNWNLVFDLHPRIYRSNEIFAVTSRIDQATATSNAWKTKIIACMGRPKNSVLNPPRIYTCLFD